MANPNKVWGQARIKVDGAVYETEGKSSLEVGGSIRAHVEADFAAGHFTESTGPSKLETSILLTAGVSLVALQRIEDATVTLEADTGQTYVINHAFVTDAVSASEGKAKVTFGGPPAEEMSL
jgi:hypothetical protein